MVGIDDACSGIRSFQATLMISLFLGELYALSAWRRALCVLAGFGLAFVFNVGRTLLLTWVASTKGIGAIASWHDPAGVTILVGCFLGLWLVARSLKKAESRKQKAEILKAEMLKAVGGKAEVRRQREAVEQFSSFSFQFFSISAFWRVPHRLAARGRSRHRTLVPRARMECAQDNRLGGGSATRQSDFPGSAFSDKTRQFLRYDEG